MDSVRTGWSLIQGKPLFATRSFSAGHVILRLDASRVADEERPFRPVKGGSEEHPERIEALRREIEEVADGGA